MGPCQYSMSIRLMVGLLSKRIRNSCSINCAASKTDKNGHTKQWLGSICYLWTHRTQLHANQIDIRFITPQSSFKSLHFSCVGCEKQHTFEMSYLLGFLFKDSAQMLPQHILHDYIQHRHVGNEAVLPNQRCVPIDVTLHPS